MISFKGIAKSYKFWLESSRNYKYVTLAWNILIISFRSIISFNLSFNIFFHFFQNFLISSSLHLSKNFCSKLFLPRKVLCSKTCAIHLFHSLLPLYCSFSFCSLHSFHFYYYFFCFIIVLPFPVFNYFFLFYCGSPFPFLLFFFVLLLFFLFYVVNDTTFYFSYLLF